MYLEKYLWFKREINNDHINDLICGINKNELTTESIDYMKYLICGINKNRAKTLDNKSTYAWRRVIRIKMF